MTLQSNIKTGYALGFSFTPLAGKRPTRKGWQAAPRETIDQALSWAAKGNVGLRCGSISAPPGKYLIVIDQDAGGDIKPLNLPKTVTVKTSSGYHYYYYSNKPMGNTAGALAPHVDTRGDGGQVVYPGSIHPDTCQHYHFLPGLGLGDVPIAILPDNIGSKPKPVAQAGVKSMKYALAQLEYECNQLREAEEGSRNNQLNKSAFRLGTFIAQGHLSADDAQNGLLATALAVGLSRSEAIATIRSGLTAGTRQPVASKGKLTIEMCTDMGNAKRLVNFCGDKIRYCHNIGKWLVWNGTHWEWDATGKIYQLAMDAAIAIFREASQVQDAEESEAINDWAVKSQGRAHIDAMIHLARALVPVRTEQLDNDIYLFNCQNATVNLRTGESHEHSPSDYITRVAPIEYRPDAKCPLWDKFMNRIFDGNPDIINFLQRLTGYTLSGDTSEQTFPIFYGGGQNGKSVFMDTVMGLMGPYAQNAPMNLLIDTGQTQHATDVACLMGKRLVQCSETEEGRKLKVALVKQITGDKRMTARFMRQDNFEFDITHKAIMVTNHKPVIKEDSEGIWRRIKLVPFTEYIKPEERDGRLYEKLRNEWSGILSWMVRGFQEWQSEGLGLPMEIALATEEYREEFDHLKDFISDCCEIITHESVGVSVKEMRQSYLDWAYQNNVKFPLGVHSFNERMEQKGFKRKNIRQNGNNAKCWSGIALYSVLG